MGAGQINMRSLKFFLTKTWSVLTAPRVVLHMRGDEPIRAIYRAFTRRHPKFLIIGAKALGAELIPLPDSHGTYVKSFAKELARRKFRKALRSGYEYRTFAGRDHFCEILDINRSRPERQGRPMSAHHLDENQVRPFCESHDFLHGIFDQGGRLVAYAYTPETGDMFFYSVIFGHADHLESGVMYLLVSEVIKYFIERKKNQGGGPSWAMYDMAWGCKPGLHHFKRVLGFRPYNVRWVWDQR
jgi:hypothetical protein